MADRPRRLFRIKIFRLYIVGQSADGEGWAWDETESNPKRIRFAVRRYACDLGAGLTLVIGERAFSAVWLAP